MKNKIIYLFTLIFLFIGVVNAEDCIITSGTGKNIGDEIDCGGEHFYVLSSDDNFTRMISKYNLLVGDTVDKVFFDVADEDELKDKLTEEYDYKYSNWYANPPYVETYEDMDKTDKPYVYTYGFDTNKNKYFAIIGEAINPEHVLQDSKAIGFQGEYKNNTQFPFYGVIDRYYFTNMIYIYIDQGMCFQNAANLPFIIQEEDVDIIYTKEQLYNIMDPTEGYEEFCASDEVYQGYVDRSYVYNYLNSYKTELENKGIDINKIEMVSLEDVSNVLKNTVNKELDIEAYRTQIYNKYYADDASIPELFDNYGLLHVDNLKNHLDENNYNWLYSTTYYTKTATHHQPWENNFFLVSTLGDICTSGICAKDNPFIGGVRPIVTINNEYVKTASINQEQQEEQKPNPDTNAFISLLPLLVLSASFLSLIIFGKQYRNIKE